MKRPGVQRESLALRSGSFFPSPSIQTNPKTTTYFVPQFVHPHDQKSDSPMTETQPHEQWPPGLTAQMLFPDFYANDAVRLLAERSRWSVSDSDKMPIDMRELMGTGRLRGAWDISDSCLMTLEELTESLPNATNNAFYLQAQTDGLLVLDIEKTCPPEVAAELLGMSEALYSELSMSGRGYHLVLPLPPNFWDYPLATSKKVLKEEHGWYEILLDHWVTFTRNEVPAERYVGPDEDSLPETPAWEDLYASLARLAVEAPTLELDINAEKPDIPNESEIVDLMTRQPHKRELEIFHNDYSRWEFSILGVLYNRLAAILVAVKDVVEHPYDENDQAWLVFTAAQKVIPHRSKHDEYRNGMPLLLNATVSLISRRAAGQPES